jgi:hypothetical protein
VIRLYTSFLSVVVCIVFSFKKTLFLSETRDGLRAFSGADLSRARSLFVFIADPRQGGPLEEHQAVKRVRVEWRKKGHVDDFGQEYRMQKEGCSGRGKVGAQAPILQARQQSFGGRS